MDYLYGKKQGQSTDSSSSSRNEQSSGGKQQKTMVQKMAKGLGKRVGLIKGGRNSEQDGLGGSQTARGGAAFEGLEVLEHPERKGMVLLTLQPKTILS